MANRNGINDAAISILSVWISFLQDIYNSNKLSEISVPKNYTHSNINFKILNVVRTRSLYFKQNIKSPHQKLMNWFVHITKPYSVYMYKVSCQSVSLHKKNDVKYRIHSNIKMSWQTKFPPNINHKYSNDYTNLTAYFHVIASAQALCRIINFPWQSILL